MSDALSFGGWLKQRRKARDLTQEQLGDLVGCAAETIRRFEGDRLRPSRDTAQRLAEQLGFVDRELAAFVRAARSRPEPHLATDGESTPLVVEPPLAPSARERHPLPAPTTPLVGREQDVAFACALLRQATPRLLTLIGAGGTGKTRVGLEIGRTAAADFRDGVVFVALDALTDPALVGNAIGQALGVVEQGGQPIEAALTRFLHHKQMLLVLDNFEQILPAAPLVAALLAAAPELKVLVTSRAPLHLTGEHQCPVLPLPVPNLDRLPAPEALAQVAAVELFVQYVQALQPTFQLSEANARDVARICCRLDGIPLALILAAAWCKLLRPADLVARLSSSLVFLTAGARDLPARQQTLRATIDWSHQSLTPRQQMVFRRLAVFAGGGSLEAVEEICAADGDLTGDVFTDLQGLLDANLVQRVDAADGAPRVRMLETILEYALEQLTRSGEQRLLGRHASYFCRLAEVAEPECTGPEQLVWLQRLETECDNLRAALRWALDQGATELAARLGVALHGYWLFHGHISEGRQWLEVVLHTGRVLPEPLTARLYGALGSLAAAQTDFTAARSYLEQARGRYRALDDRAGVMAALNGLIGLAKHQAEYPRAQALADEALVIGRATGNSHALAVTLHALSGIALAEGDYPRATTLVEEALTYFRAAGDQHAVTRIVSCSLAVYALQLGDYGRAESLIRPYVQPAGELGDRQLGAWQRVNLGIARWRQGDTQHALELWHESLTMFDALGDKHGRAWVLLRQAPATYDRGDTAVAKDLYTAAMRLLRDLDITVGFAYAFEELANRAVVQGLAARAARLWGTAAAIRERIGHLIPPAEARLVEQGVCAARVTLGDDGFDMAWSEGRTMSLEQAHELALGEFA